MLKKFKPFWKKWPFLFKFRLILGLILFIFVLFFLYLKVVPFGHISYTRSYERPRFSGKGFILGLTPEERVVLEPGTTPRLVGDPVYFSLFTPRTFSRAKLTITYRDNLSLETPIVEAGVLVDNVVWRYDLKPLDNKALDYLMLRFDKSVAPGTLFLQKEKNYSTLRELEEDLLDGAISSCPQGLANCLAVYNYSPAVNFRFTNYRPAKPLTIETPLRGAHQLYVYLKDEPLRFHFTFVDLNQDRKAAPVTLVLSSREKIIKTVELPDENLFPGSGQAEERELIIEEKNLPAGVYRLDIKITDDMVIKKIVSSLDRLSFINKVWPVSSANKLTLYTDANYLQAKALNPGSLQTISFAGTSYELAAPYEQFDFITDRNSLVKEIKLQKDDVILENNGVFSFSPESLFNPMLDKVDRFFSVETPVKYIIANYERPQERDGLKIATAEFNLVGAYRENGKYSFMISVPGLKSEDKIKDSLEIYEIKVELTGRTLWQKIWEK